MYRARGQKSGWCKVNCSRLLTKGKSRVSWPPEHCFNDTVFANKTLLWEKQKALVLKITIILYVLLFHMHCYSSLVAFVRAKLDTNWNIVMMRISVDVTCNMARHEVLPSFVYPLLSTPSFLSVFDFLSFLFARKSRVACRFPVCSAAAVLSIFLPSFLFS